jgi:hypothetical protein
MLVDATGSIDITEITNAHGQIVVSDSEVKEIQAKLASGDYVLDLKNGVIFNLAGGNFIEVAKFDWSVNNMEYDFDFWDEEG